MDQENKDPESLSEIINKLGTNYYMFKQLINSEIRKAYWLGYNDHRNKMLDGSLNEEAIICDHRAFLNKEIMKGNK